MDEITSLVTKAQSMLDAARKNNSYDKTKVVINNVDDKAAFAFFIHNQQQCFWEKFFFNGNKQEGVTCRFTVIIEEHIYYVQYTGKQKFIFGCDSSECKETKEVDLISGAKQFNMKLTWIKDEQISAKLKQFFYTLEVLHSFDEDKQQID